MTHKSSAEDVLLFWFGAPPERGKAHKQWFVKDEAFDREVRSRFLGLHEDAADGKLAHLKETADGCLALIVLLDQFPRNMFRGTPRAFATDALALEAARPALARGFDRGMLAVERLFLYLPFEHSEALADQDLACELTRPLDALEPGLEAYRYALLHRDIIRRFGRFPHRNAILGRPSTPAELEFLKGPGSSF
ncbi:MAG TPA: DUF924 family protein [Burkholderiales bacterium]|nr:DUF924 family protein [Burkholderiales bacterium]